MSRIRLVVLLTAAFAAPNALQAATFPAKITGTEISVLIRSTVVALDQANDTGNYSVLHDLGDKPFQGSFSQAALADMFRAFREQGVDLNSVVLFDAELDAPPELTQDGYLRLLGHFPTTPNEVIFDITYRYEDGPWRIDGINVGMRKPRAITLDGKQVTQAIPPISAPVPAPQPKWRSELAPPDGHRITAALANDNQPTIDEGI